MKPSALIPWLCGTALVAMIGSGASHWYSVRQFVAFVGAQPHPAPHAPAFFAQQQVPPPAESTVQPEALPTPVAPPRPAPRPPASVASRGTSPAVATLDAQRELYTEFISEIKSLRQQNQDLLNQLAETNRDVMELQFRVDTHSESFRPLKITQDPPTAHDSGPGVLPPRDLPSEELFNQ